MKQALFILAIILSFSAFAGKDHTLEIKLVDKKSREPLTGLRVTAYSYKKLDETVFSDGEGVVVFNWKKSLKYLSITVTDTSKHYLTKSIGFDKEDLGGIKMSVTFAMEEAPDMDSIFAEFRKIDQMIDQHIREENLDSTVYGLLGEHCPESVDPGFVGGPEAMQKYINESLVYPQEAIEHNEQGYVYTKFIVEVDGTISHVEIMRGVSLALDYESVRILYDMPKWEPGSCDGKPVRMTVLMPIIFRLE